MTPTDPVEDFFAHERSTIHPLPTDDAHWASLVEAHRASRRSRWTAYAAGVAAAAVLAGGIGWALRPGTDGNASLPGTTGASTSTTSALTATKTSGPSVTTAPPTTAPPTTAPPTTGPPTSGPPTSTAPTKPASLPVPADFKVVSLSNAGQDTLFALGTTSCSQVACAALARSTDNGRTWRVVSSFPAKGSAVTTAPAGVPTATSLTQVRFASPTVGWVFGGGVRQTTDGGASWHDYGQPGSSVVDLETDGTTVVLVSAIGECTAEACPGGGIVSSASVKATSAKAVGMLADPTFSDATVSWHGGVAVVSAVTSSHKLTPAAVGPKGLTPLTVPCASGSGDPGTVVSPADGDTLVTVCVSGGAAGSIGYDVAASTDRGATWKTVSGNPPLLLANAGHASVAAVDATHLLAVSGGTADLHGSMQVSSDGGRTWHGPAAAPPLPDRGWAWVGAPGGSSYYAVPVAGDGGYWISTDRGEHWKRVGVAG